MQTGSASLPETLTLADGRKAHLLTVDDGGDVRCPDCGGAGVGPRPLGGDVDHECGGCEGRGWRPATCRVCLHRLTARCAVQRGRFASIRPGTWAYAAEDELGEGYELLCLSCVRELTPTPPSQKPAGESLGPQPLALGPGRGPASAAAEGERGCAWWTPREMYGPPPWADDGDDVDIIGDALREVP